MCGQSEALKTRGSTHGCLKSKKDINKNEGMGVESEEESVKHDSH